MNRTLVSLLLAASVTAAGSAASASGPVKGYITGRAVDERGQPLAGVEIDADNTIAGRSDLIAYTDARGEYRIDVTLLPTTWSVSAHQTLKYNGYSVAVELVPDDPRAVPGLRGGVRNFVFKPKPTTAQDPYGNLGMVMLEEALGEFAIDFTQVEITLTPRGPLANGAAGKPQVVHLRQTSSGWIAPNVMWGTYTVKATMNGRTLELRRRARGIVEYPWKPAYTGGFYLDYDILLPNMFLEARLPGAS